MTDRAEAATRARPIRVWRVEFDPSAPPDGWDHETADAHPRFALWGQSGDGYHEPLDSYICTDKHGAPIWSPPHRRNFLSRSSAVSFSAELHELGVPHTVLRSEPVRFEASSGSSTSPDGES